MTLTESDHLLFAGLRKTIGGASWASAMINKGLRDRGERALAVFVEVTTTYPVLRRDSAHRFPSEQGQDSLHAALVLWQSVPHRIAPQTHLTLDNPLRFGTLPVRLGYTPTVRQVHGPNTVRIGAISSFLDTPGQGSWSLS
jgi:hypothetical protein